MKEFDLQKTCDNIFILVSQNNLTDSKFAKLLGVTPQAVSKWRRGLNAPSIDTLTVITGLFGVSFDELISFHENNYTYDLEDGL